MRAFGKLISRFRRDERGVFAVFFAIIAIVLIATSGAVVDFTYTQTARSRAQTALDAAALALQPSISTLTTDQIKTKAQSILVERLADASITATVDSAAVNTTAGTLTLNATITVPTAFVQLIGLRNMTAHLLSEVTRGSSDIEVAVALDITGSMAGQKLTDLKSATNTLIDLVVQTSQTPSYSKMAIIPWSNSPNVSSTYADNIRGAVTGASGKAITAATWASGSAISISGITKASAAVITTSSNHGLSTGDVVYITGVSGMTYFSSTLNGAYYTITKVSNTKFSIPVNTSSYSSYSSGGTATKCALTSCDITVTSASHGFNDGDAVYVTGISGMTGLNSNTYVVSGKTTNTLVLTGSASAAVGQTYTSGGTLYCTVYGCPYYYFTNASGGKTTFPVTTCVSDRTTNPFTDDAPSTTSLKFVYTSTSTGNGCPTATIIPLSTDKTALKATVTSLAAAGSTAGHLGLAWGWYMVSPNFAYLWPTASRPAAYNTSNLIKAVVLMTDGDFNTQYCNGVISNDTASGNGSASDHINCASQNGLSAAQATTLCTNIKAKGIILYTVGFDMAGNTTAATLLGNCATDANHYFSADTGTDLQAAFQQIGEALSALRVSK